MATASSVGPEYLWRADYKINHDDGGFTFSCWIANKILADARTAAEDVGGRMRRLLPQDAEIYYAALKRWDTKRNAFYLNNVVGPGLYGSELTVPVVLKCDNPKTCLDLRFENPDGEVVPRKFNLIPDTIIVGALVDDPITNQVGQVLAAPAAAAADAVYKVQFLAFIQAIMFYTHHVKANPVPGGAYTYYPWQNCYVDHVGVKKGGHVFIG